jgi:glycerophosphoryl diester phosphodiesterase
MVTTFSARSRRHRKPALPPNRSPLVIAHRGASSDVAEHTLPAYLAAIDVGADGLECDVRLTRDGHLVCVHDRTVTRTSNGVGVVSDLDLAGLLELDFESWKSARLPLSADDLVTSYLHGVVPDYVESPGPEGKARQVLTLSRLLEAVVDAGRPLQLLVETKHPTRYGGLVEKELIRILKRYGLSVGTPIENGSTATVMSFAPVALRRVRLLAPRVPLVLLTDRTRAVRRDGSLPTAIGITGPGISVLRADPGYVARAHRSGNRVFCWTVDTPDDIRLVTELGVDAVITNRPRTVLRELGR